MSTARGHIRVLRYAGFTLVELLVVIGIIAVLVGILLPALSRAKQSGQSVTCLSNLRQIVQACQLYANDNDGTIIPGQWAQSANNPMPPQDSLYADETWCNILVNQHYLTAPDGSVGQTQTLSPQTHSVFCCPSGNQDALDPALLNTAGVPASRVDGRGTECVRYYSFSGVNAVDCWYGINADNQNTTLAAGPPCRRIYTNPPNLQLLGRMTMITRASETVFFFDGLYLDYDNVGPNRVNARHFGQTQTNIAFFDGHCAAYRTADLPGGLGNAQLTDFTLANLSANFPPPAPVWLMEQQY
jgi:prepilin-type N-terminal cleavage/methylation domain-containing protein/prepilin-type processing-associated H-X9-DG protein